MAIEVRNLSHIYSPGMPDEQIALDNVNFDISDGEVVAIIGHTGSGKSTLLQHLNGLLKATSGTIKIDDTEVTDPKTVMRDVRRKVGLVFQYPEYQLFDETVAKDIAFGPRNLGLTEEEIESRVRESIDLVGLDYDKIAEKSPFELSGGQKRRVAIAGVIAMKPKVLILDEPTAGLDPGAHKDILDMIKHIHDRENNIIIFVSHNMADVAELADKVMVMSDGKLVMMGTTDEIFMRADELASIGLSVPPVTQFLRAVKQNGASIRTDIIHMSCAKEEIYNYLSKKDKQEIQARKND